MAFDGEWFRTGDVAEVIGRRVRIVGRIKDIVDPQRNEDSGGRGRGGGRPDPRGSRMRRVPGCRCYDGGATGRRDGVRRRCRNDARRRQPRPSSRPACPSTSCPRSWCSGISRCRSTPTARSNATSSPRGPRDGRACSPSAWWRAEPEVMQKIRADLLHKLSFDARWLRPLASRTEDGDDETVVVLAEGERELQVGPQLALQGSPR